MSIKNLFPIVVLLIILISCNSKEMKIGIQPYEGFDKNLIDIIAKQLRDSYNVDIVILPSRNLPKSAFVQIKSPRYRADSLLIDLKKNKPDSITYIIGLTTRDISTTKRDKYGKIKEPAKKYSDWGVFGLGYRLGPSCVVSIFRIKISDNELFISRLKKICVHELGHNLGLKHCENRNCVMEDAAETIKTIDRVGMELCDDCKRQIK